MNVIKQTMKEDSKTDRRHIKGWFAAVGSQYVARRKHVKRVCYVFAGIPVIGSVSDVGVYTVASKPATV